MAKQVSLFMGRKEELTLKQEIHSQIKAELPGGGGAGGRQERQDANLPQVSTVLLKGIPIPNHL